MSSTSPSLSVATLWKSTRKKFIKHHPASKISIFNSQRDRNATTSSLSPTSIQLVLSLILISQYHCLNFWQDRERECDFHALGVGTLFTVVGICADTTVYTLRTRWNSRGECNIHSSFFTRCSDIVVAVVAHTQHQRFDRSYARDQLAAYNRCSTLLFSYVTTTEFLLFSSMHFISLWWRIDFMAFITASPDLSPHLRSTTTARQWTRFAKPKMNSIDGWNLLENSAEDKPNCCILYTWFRNCVLDAVGLYCEHALHPASPLHTLPIENRQECIVFNTCNSAIKFCRRIHFIRH